MSLKITDDQQQTSSQFKYSTKSDTWFPATIISSDTNNNKNIEPGILISPPIPVHKADNSNEHPDDEKPKTFFERCKTRIRFILSTLMLLCLTSVWSNIICFNFALICIQPKHGDNHDESDNAFDDSNDPVDIKGSHFTNHQKIALTSAVAISAAIANFIAVSLITRYGVRSIFVPLGLISAISTALFPIGLKAGFTMSCVLRCLQGIAFSANFPVIGAFTNKWAYHKQSGMIVSILVAYVQLAPTLSDSISGAICESSLGWEFVFYIHAIWTAALFTILWFLYRNNPGKHPLVGKHEFRKVTVNKSNQTKKELRKIPYKTILKDLSVWAVWIGGIGNFFCVNAIFLYSPNYIHYVLNMDVSSTGAMAAVPAVLQFLVKLAGGTTSDKIKFLGETNKLRLYNTLAFCTSGIIFIILSFLDHNNSMLCFIVLSVATGCLGLTTGGFFKNGPVLAQQYSQFVTGNISQTITTTMLIIPFIIESIAPNNTDSEWQIVFWIIAAVLISTNVIYCIFCHGHPASWTKVRTLSEVASDNQIDQNRRYSANIDKIYPKI